MKINFIITKPKKYSFWIIIILSLLFLLYPIPYTLYPNPTFAQSCGGGTTPRAEGLITTQILSPKFTTSSGACVIGPKSAFQIEEIDNFEDLKSEHFDRKAGSKVTITSNILPSIVDGTAYFKTGNLAITQPISGSGTAVVIVDGDLTIGPISDNQVIYGTPLTGLVFIVSGNIYIDKTVNRVDAVLISSGTIYTASDNTTNPATACSKSSVLPPNGALTLNGSLISLNSAAPIQFCRYLVDNSNPAEIINHQVKYIVILRKIISETLQRWSEIP